MIRALIVSFCYQCWFFGQERKKTEVSSLGVVENMLKPNQRATVDFKAISRLLEEKDKRNKKQAEREQRP